jgi:thiol:disulfide interchange protein DsbC
VKRSTILFCTLLSGMPFLSGCGNASSNAVATTTATTAPITPNTVDLAALKKTLQKNYEDRIVGEIRPAEIAGLYEFVLDRKEVFYSDATGHFIIGGWIYDAQKDQNLTKLREAALRTDAIKQLNYAYAIKQVRGNGERKLVVFSDPFCPSCHDLEPNLAQLDNVTIYTFLYPFVEANHDPQHKVSRKIWCDDDRNAAWHAWMSAQKQPKNPGTCKFPLDELMQIGQQLELTGVPSIIFADGTVDSGALSKEELEQGMNTAVKTPAKVAGTSALLTKKQVLQ